MELGVHANERDQTLVLPWLLHKVTRAALDGFDGQVDVAPSSHDDDGKARIEFLDARKEIEALLAGGGVARVVEIDEQHVVIAHAQRFKQQAGRTDAVHIDALRGEQQLDGLKDVRLIVGNQHANSLLLTWNVPPSVTTGRSIKDRTPRVRLIKPAAPSASIPQGLKPTRFQALFAARLKPCPFKTDRRPFKADL